MLDIKEEKRRKKRKMSAFKTLDTSVELCMPTQCPILTKTGFKRYSQA